MALYDDYFTNEDKPFAENLNDALLLSNVFDMTVPIQVPKMFSNSTWVSTTSPRKCGVAVLTLKDGLPSGVTVGTDSTTGNSTLTGTGTVKLSFYPNFNSFGKFKSMTWENDGTIVVNLKTATGTTIASNISKGAIENQSSDLRTLQEIVIEIVFTNATLKSFEVVMENKQQTRYGAEVGITDVTGLDDRLNAKVNIVDIKDNLTSSDTNKPLSANQGLVLKTLVDGKSDVNHNHDGIYVQSAGNVWIMIQEATFNMTYMVIYVNPTLRLVDFHYYRPDFQFSNTNAQTLLNTSDFSVNISNQSVNIKPLMNTPLASYNQAIVGGISFDDNSTKITVQSNSTGSKNINLRGMWHY